MTENHQMLRDFAASGSEEAFRELVRRYINLVYSTALRMLGGDRHAAEDVTQTVFLHLSRNARKLPPDVMLGGWLHRDTCHVACNFLRHERRRRAREQEAALMEATPDHSRANLALVAPILDEAIDALNEADRAAILLRFFEQQDFRRVGAALGSTEDGARMRVSRALEKLQRLLTKRGVALSSTALAAGLTSEAVTAAPAALAGSVAAAALGSSAALAGPAVTTIKIIAMTKIQAALCGVLVLGAAAVPLWLQSQSRQRTVEENRALRAQVEQLSAATQQLSNQLAAVAEKPIPESDQQRELLKLRGEVGGLRRDLADAQAQAKVQAERRTTEQQQARQAEAFKELAITKMNYGKDWMLAFAIYAQHHGGQLPTNFDSAVSFAPGNVTNQTSLVPDQFEIVYTGSLNEVSNPQSLIVIREKEASQTSDGGWVRDYTFADGHSEIHRAADGNFRPWEALHMIMPPAQPGQ
jgi:RNA polymerase sigma factor (sigma-70 family)